VGFLKISKEFGKKEKEITLSLATTVNDTKDNPNPRIRRKKKIERKRNGPPEWPLGGDNVDA